MSLNHYAFFTIALVSALYVSADDEIFYADPTIYPLDGKYYLIGTKQGSPEGFKMLESDNLLQWHACPDSMVLVKGQQTYGDRWFWAPQILPDSVGYTLAYTANEQVAVAHAPGIMGLYTQKNIRPVDGSEHNIDPFIFIDDDGKQYLYHVRFNHGNYIWVGEYDPHTESIVPGTLRQCLSCDQSWENTPTFPSDPIMEGPTVIKIGDIYYLFYSANHYQSPDYAVGYATAKSPLGPWVKNPDNPIIHPSIVGEKGSGHGDIFYDHDGNMRYVYHVHYSDTEVAPRRTRIVTLKVDNDNITVDTTTIIKPTIDHSTYANPVIGHNMPDPTIIKGDDGYYYVYATESRRQLPIYRSKNLIEWEYVGAAFTPDERPNFVENASIWAPDVSRLADRYVMHFSMSTWGGEWECGIGSAWSDSPAGPFHDAKKMFISNEIGVQNCIDPFFIEDNSKKYLFFGSFSGIYALELSDDALSVKEDAKPKRIAGSAYEATYIHKHDGYYYLFASSGTCCDGLNSTYHVVVGRSENIMGPYVDGMGRKMLDNNHEIVLQKNKAFVGPGHNSEIITDISGQDWILYHAFESHNPEDGRKLMLDRVSWQNGWPVIGDGTPSVRTNR